MKINKVTFSFENCESITVPGRYIFSYHAGDISEVCTMPNRGLGDSICIYKYVQDFAIGILNDAKDSRRLEAEDFLNDSEEEKEYFTNRGMADYYEKLGRLHRLDSNDLAQVEIEFWDGYNIESIHHVHYYVDWEGSDEENSLEKTYVNKFGDIYISVNRGNTENEYNMFLYFSKEDLDSDYWMNCIRGDRELDLRGDTSKYLEVQKEIRDEIWSFELNTAEGDTK